MTQLPGDAPLPPYPPILGALLLGMLLTLVTAALAAADDSVDDSGDDDILRKEVVVRAPIDAVWQAWTTERGAEFVSPESRIELEPGGEYAWFLHLDPDENGKRGGEGSTVTSFVPREMLALRWTYPPSIADLRSRGATSQVVVRFEPAAPGHVRVRLAMHDWAKGDGGRGAAYFDSAWGSVLSRLKAHLESAREEDGELPLPAVERSWTDGHVHVRATEPREKRQEFTVVLPAPVEEVWSLLTTEEGFRRLGAKEPVVELRTGGPWGFWPGATSRVMAFLPREMLSASGSAPPKFPTVREGGTWSAIYFEPVGGESASGDAATLLRVVVVGWRPGEAEWDAAFDYFLKNNAIFFNAVHDVLEGDDATP